MNKILQKIKKVKNTKNVKKVITIYCFITAIIFSIITQILHCLFFYYCRAFFINILEGNTDTFFFDVEQYIIMILLLILYGLGVNYLHKMLLNKYIQNKIKALLLEDILLGWKYFVFLLAFLVKLFLVSPWALVIYFWVLNFILWKQNTKKVVITTYSILVFCHIYTLNSIGLYHLNGIFLLFYSSIYFAISPCYNTIMRIKKLSI